MAYTTIDVPTSFFNTVLYTGNATARSITGVGFQPDWVWGKNRSTTNWHDLEDSVRGATKRLSSNETDAEATETVNFTSFDSDGFSVGTGQNVNGNGNSIVVWNWKAGTSFSNDASATSIGTIDSSGSTNQTAGFSIVSWTGTGSAGTVAHNLGSVPEWYIVKNRSDGNNWAVYHHKSNANPEQYVLYLDGTYAATDDSGLTNDTAPTSTVFSLTNGNYGNQNSYNYIGYFFSEVKGYSKFGSLVSNNSDNGTFAYTGFSPSWVMLKGNVTDTWSDWYIFDNKRKTFNLNDVYLQANDSAAETGAGANYAQIDMLSNGFKIRRDANWGYGGSGTTLFYMAFAESPFVNSNGVPTNAR